jgi:hypothetical protein
MNTTASTLSERVRRLAPNMGWVAARRQEWREGLETALGTERWQVDRDVSRIPAWEGMPAATEQPPEPDARLADPVHSSTEVLGR